MTNNQPQDFADHEEQFQGTDSQGCNVLNFDCDGEGEKWENFNNLTMSPELPFEEALFNDFAASCLGDDNADLSLDSLEFLLDCEEWPTNI